MSSTELPTKHLESEYTEILEGDPEDYNPLQFAKLTRRIFPRTRHSQTDFDRRLSELQRYSQVDPEVLRLYLWIPRHNPMPPPINPPPDKPNEPDSHEIGRTMSAERMQASGVNAVDTRYVSGTPAGMRVHSGLIPPVSSLDRQARPVPFDARQNASINQVPGTIHLPPLSALLSDSAIQPPRNPPIQPGVGLRPPAELQPAAIFSQRGVPRQLPTSYLRTSSELSVAPLIHDYTPGPLSTTSGLSTDTPSLSTSNMGQSSVGTRVDSIATSIQIDNRQGRPATPSQLSSYSLGYMADPQGLEPSKAGLGANRPEVESHKVKVKGKGKGHVRARGGGHLGTRNTEPRDTPPPVVNSIPAKRVFPRRVGGHYEVSRDEAFAPRQPGKLKLFEQGELVRYLCGDNSKQEWIEQANEAVSLKSPGDIFRRIAEHALHGQRTADDALKIYKAAKSNHAACRLYIDTFKTEFHRYSNEDELLQKIADDIESAKSRGIHIRASPWSILGWVRGNWFWVFDARMKEYENNIANPIYRSGIISSPPDHIDDLPEVEPFQVPWIETGANVPVNETFSAPPSQTGSHTPSQTGSQAAGSSLRASRLPTTGRLARLARSATGSSATRPSIARTTISETAHRSSGSRSAASGVRSTTSGPRASAPGSRPAPSGSHSVASEPITSAGVMLLGEEGSEPSGAAEYVAPAPMPAAPSQISGLTRLTTSPPDLLTGGISEDLRNKFLREQYESDDRRSWIGAQIRLTEQEIRHNEEMHNRQMDYTDRMQAFKEGGAAQRMHHANEDMAMRKVASEVNVRATEHQLALQTAAAAQALPHPLPATTLTYPTLAPTASMPAPPMAAPVSAALPAPTAPPVPNLHTRPHRHPSTFNQAPDSAHATAATTVLAPTPSYATGAAPAIPTHSHAPTGPGVAPPSAEYAHMHVQSYGPSPYVHGYGHGPYGHPQAYGHAPPGYGYFPGYAFVPAPPPPTITPQYVTGYDYSHGQWVGYPPVATSVPPAPRFDFSEMLNRQRSDGMANSAHLYMQLPAPGPSYGPAVRAALQAGPSALVGGAREANFPPEAHIEDYGTVRGTPPPTAAEMGQPMEGVETHTPDDGRVATRREN
ncbi:hypothetical protein RhiJN_21602 [Ceratobasidium sp. AG-Ba]|nr:hypothetical protein RhiJN_21602 [Ceratobasidium sp. AG-Ba]